MKLTKLESIRGFAACYVVLHHTVSDQFHIMGYNISWLFRFGQEAVILFFLLSGFVIQYSFQRSLDKSFSSFFNKRFLRIYIPLVCVFILNYILLCQAKAELIRIDSWTLIGNLLMLQDIGFVKPHVLAETFLGNLPLWSLSYEWWFYIIFFFITTKFQEKASRIVYIISIFIYSVLFNLS